MMGKLARDHRNSDLAKIHLAKKQLAMTEEDYRAMLWSVGRVTSSKDLDHAGRQAVLEHLRACGFKPTGATSAPRPKRPTPAPDKRALVSRIRAQLISLGRLPDSYADGIAKQMFGVEYFEWCNHDQLHAITTALGYEQQRRGAKTA